MLLGKMLKVSIVLDAATIAAMPVPIGVGRRFTVVIQAHDQEIEITLNAKSLRRAIAAINEAGPDNVYTVLRSLFRLEPAPSFKGAYILVCPARKPEIPDELSVAE